MEKIKKDSDRSETHLQLISVNLKTKYEVIFTVIPLIIHQCQDDRQIMKSFCLVVPDKSVTKIFKGLTESHMMPILVHVLDFHLQII